MKQMPFTRTPYAVPLQIAIALTVVLIAFFLRFHNLGAQSLWNDEGSSYVQATRSFADIAANAARDIHPPGYYWLLAIWRGAAGDSELALRSLSAFASVLTVAFTYALGKRLFNPLAGLLAALFVALNTFSIYYAQEARMYALLALWGVMGMWALVEGLSFQKSRLGIWVAFALINAAGLYTQYAYPFVMLAQGVIALVWLAGRVVRGRHASSLRHSAQVLGSYVAANVLTILLYLPWLPTALRQVTEWPSTGEPIPAGEALGTITGWMMFGITFDLQSGQAQAIPAAVVFLGAGLAGWLYLRGKMMGWRIAVPAAWVIVPISLFLILGLFRPANLKFLLPSQIGFAVLMAASISILWLASLQRNKPTFLAARVVVFLQLAWLAGNMIVSVPPLYGDPAYQRPDYRAMVAQITAEPRPGDAIILDAPNQEEVFRYYYKGDAPVYPLPAGLGGNDAETQAAVRDVISRHERIFVLFWGEAERDPNRVVENTLDSLTFQAGIDQWYGDVRFVQYAAPAAMPDLTPSGAVFGDVIVLEGYALSATTMQAGDVLQARLAWRTDAPLDRPYKVFLQLLNGDGVLVAQRDSEPGGGSQPTTAWKAGETVIDQHGLTIPHDLATGRYRLIAGLYDRDDPVARLAVDGGDWVELGMIEVHGGS